MAEKLKLGENIYRYRFTDDNEHESMLTRYGLISSAPCGEPETMTCRDDGDEIIREGKYTVPFSVKKGAKEGFELRFSLSSEDRLFGLGDESRDCLEKHGKVAVIKQENVRSYGPVPYLMSSRGWAVLINLTYAHTFDICASEKDTLIITSDRGVCDFFVFNGEGLRDALYLAGKVTGRPLMLPKGGYGLTYVMNEEANARTLLDDSLRFYDRGIPVDIFGLEPSWMSIRYDYSVDKKWNGEKFPFPSWVEDNYSGTWAWPWNLHRMNRMLSLWLCNDYDLLWKEENDAFTLSHSGKDESAAIDDERLKGGLRMDSLTRAGVDWFDHLKRFVDNGAEAFKLDGANQVIPHPDRLWAGRYSDAEVRNVYPVIYVKQMKEGYENHTGGKRAMIYSCSTYPGTWKYAATWAGDTGCNAGVLLSLMNFAMCGHSNTSFDMTCEKDEMMHVGFLAPWTQHQGWANWTYPWYCGEKTEESYRRYSRLRSSLFPYIYSYAHIANETSLPILRPLSLEYENTDKYDKVYNEYFLGDAFLVSVFDNNVVLPDEDDWYDFYTGKLIDGPRSFELNAPEGWGGGLFVRAGSVIPMQPWQNSLREKRTDRITLHVYPSSDSEKTTEFTLYEDDYETTAYERGEIARTRITLCGDRVTVYPREGRYPNMPEEYKYDVVIHNPDGTETQHSL